MAAEEDTKSITSSHESDWSEPEDEVYEFKAFHDDAIFDSLEGLLEHEKVNHDFDLQLLRKSLGLDLYATIRVVNCVRETKMTEDEIRNSIADITNNDKYLQPVLENDAVLFHLVDDDEDAPVPVEDDWKQRYQALEAQHALLQQSLRLAIDARPTDDEGLQKPDNDSYYFDSYGYNDIHETMLKDAVRTDAYRDAVYDNKDVFKGKTVLDVGCGTGILSMFCAKAGAKHVYAIDNSNIIDKARSNAYENGLDDEITFIKGKVEEIKLPVEKVDIIISEWMGYALLYESMLDSVLDARDRFLAPDGLMMPSLATMVIAGLSDEDYFDDRVNFWSDIYGFKMGAMKDGIFDGILIDSLSAKSLGTEPVIFERLDLHAVRARDLVFRRPFTLRPLPGRETVVAFHVWFDTFFTRTREASRDPVEPIEGAIKTRHGNAFSTGPHGTPTHWKQAVLLIDGKVAIPAGGRLEGEIEYRKGANNPRFLEIVVSWTVVSPPSSDTEAEAESEHRSQVWHLA